MNFHSRRTQVEALPLHAEAQEVIGDSRYEGQQQNAQNPALHKTQHGQSEYIESGVLAEYRLGLAEGGCIGEAQEYFPARCHYCAENDGEYGYNADADCHQRAAHEIQEVVRQRKSYPAPRDECRGVNARARHDCHCHRTDNEQHYPSRKDLDEYAPIAQVVEPQPIGIYASPEDKQREKHDRYDREGNPL